MAKEEATVPDNVFFKRLN